MGSGVLGLTSAAQGASIGASGAAVEIAPKPGRRRSFSAAEKLRIVRQAAACSERGQVEAPLRREGIYSSHLASWRKQVPAARAPWRRPVVEAHTRAHGRHGAGTGRVADWQSSGETFSRHCKGKAFSPSALRYWVQRLRQAMPAGQAPALSVADRGDDVAASKPTKRAVRAGRMARVERTPAPAVASGAMPRQASVASDKTIVVELGSARVSVRPGFDRSTLAAVLEVVAAHGAGR